MNKRLIAMLLTTAIAGGTFTQVPVILKANTVDEACKVIQETDVMNVRNEEEIEYTALPSIKSIPQENRIVVTPFVYGDNAAYNSVFKVTGIQGYSNNGGKYAQSDLKNAFDGNLQTHWETAKPNSDTFKNEVIITFNEIEEINRIVYAPRAGNKGHVTEMSIYASVEEIGDNFELVATGSAPVNSKLSEFKFQATPFKRLKFVFDTASRDWAAAGEFMFYKEDVLETRVNDLFIDGTMSELNPEYQSVEVLEEMEALLANHPIPEKYRNQIDMAKDMLINPERYKENVYTFKQNGNMVKKANDLMIGFYANDLEPTGIVAKPGETLKVYLDLEPGAPAPQLCIAQHEASWAGWKYTYTLKPGLNEIKVPLTNMTGYDVKTIPGGPVYLQNKYTQEQQGKAPKVRIEGGESFPLYSGKIGKEAFMKELEAYKEKMAQNPDTTVDLVEISLDNLIFTGTATGAYNALVRDGQDIEHIAKFWTEMVDGLLLYGGFDNSTPNQSREGLVANVRLMQPFGALYAYIEHIGVQRNFMEEFFNVDKLMKGSWGIIHEFGHLIDMWPSSWGEVTNNMWSNKVAIETHGGDRVPYPVIFENVASDIDTGKGYEEFDWFGRLGLFWQIELAFDEFWPKVEQRYRELRPQLHDKNAVFVEFSSNVVGYDLTEHFLRYKFITPDSVVNNVDHLPKLDKKIWYLHTDAYKYTGTGFAKQVIPEILDIEKLSNGNKLTIASDSSQKEDLLGYEIIRDGVVIGFTDTDEFVDKHRILGENHTYTVKAVDKALNIGEASEPIKAFKPNVIAHTAMLPVHTEFNPLDYAKAYDHEGNDISSLIEVIHNTVDTTQKGRYEVTYKIEDSMGNITTKTIEVLIGSDMDYLSDLRHESAKVGWKNLQKDKSPNETPITLSERGKQIVYEKGLGVHADSEVVYNIEGKNYTTFSTMIGIDQSVAHLTGSSAKFLVYADDVLIYESNVKNINSSQEQVILDVTGAKQIKLVTDSVGNNKLDHTVWADAKFLAATSLPTIEIPEELSYIPQHQLFDTLEGVQALDTEDGDITAQIQVVGGDIDTSRSGEHTVTYTVIDSEGGQVSKDRKVIVYSDVQYLSDMNWDSATTAYGSVRKDRSSTNSMIKVGVEGQTREFDKGIGTHAYSEIVYDLSQAPTAYLEAYLGVDRNIEEQTRSSVKFEIYADNVKVYESPIKKWEDDAEHVKLDLTGTQKLKLIVTDAGNGISADHASFADIKVLVLDSKPILEISEESTIEIGNAFNLMDGVRATDAEDGDITSQVEVIGTVDVNTSGEYQLIYRVTDSDGNVAEERKTIVVGKTNYLSDMNYKNMNLGYGGLGIDKAPSGQAIRLRDENGQDVIYKKGLGLHAVSEITYDLTGLQAEWFKAYVGVDGAMDGRGSVGFEVWLDGQKVEETGIQYGGRPQTYIEVNVKGANELKLRVNDGGNGIGSDHGVWGDAKIFSINSTNKQQLQEMIDTALELEEIAYTPQSWLNLQEALENAEAILADFYAVQEAIDNTLVNLEQAIQSLQIIVDRTQLKELLDSADAKTPEGHDALSWENFMYVREQAREVYQDENATQEDINHIVFMLELEIRELESDVVVDKSELEQVIQRTDILDKLLYTQDSWQFMQDKLTIARNVLVANGGSIDQPYVNKVTQELNQAIDDLQQVEERVKLKEVLNYADAKVPETYDAIAWETFLYVREQAREVYLDENATQEEIAHIAFMLELEMRDLEASAVIETLEV